MPDVMADRRAAPRYPLVLVVDVIERANGNRFCARTSDVSRTGCYVDTLNPQPAGTDILILLTHRGETIEIPARVVYVSPALGMGIRFDDPVPPKRLAVLDRWLQAAAQSDLQG